MACLRGPEGLPINFTKVSAPMQKSTYLGIDIDAKQVAVVTPLIKKANLPSDDLKNYRPISGLSLISKLVEHVVANQPLEHTHVHNLDNLSAYNAGHSTETALLSIKKLS